MTFGILIPITIRYNVNQKSFCLDLLEAVKTGSTDEVIKLLDAGVNIEEKNHFGGL